MIFPWNDPKHIDEYGDLSPLVLNFIVGLAILAFLFGFIPMIFPFIALLLFLAVFFGLPILIIWGVCRLFIRVFDELPVAVGAVIAAVVLILYVAGFENLSYKCYESKMDPVPITRVEKAKARKSFREEASISADVATIFKSHKQHKAARKKMENKEDRILDIIDEVFEPIFLITGKVGDFSTYHLNKVLEKKEKKEAEKKKG